ncbi:aspartyl/asparaginyl beta-hydroxylase domain-containing protein [Actinoplanes sp. NPDC051851]|uniref:aspartyl/asparaginyl beta-hydroxylase domain-containing protein n=1 Tax=Actinoplanes sp. NPDC051851 TaxID=3154753 RepID=UPI00343FFFA6
MTITSAGPTTLPTEIAALRQLDPGLMERLRHEALTIPRNWSVEYGDYQNGGWHTLSLLNDTGDPRDVTIRDCPQPQPTALLEQMPAVQELIAELGVKAMWARLARLDAGAFLWEHRDYGELTTTERHRLHVPLVTNSSAYLVIGGTKVHMSVGRVWRLTPTSPHGVCNRHGPSRIHLIIDCYADDTFAALNRGEVVGLGHAELLPVLEQSQIDEVVATATGLAELDYDHAAETTLLKLFYQYAMPEGQAYDLISGMYAALGREGDAQRWTAKKTVMLGRP